VKELIDLFAILVIFVTVVCPALFIAGGFLAAVFERWRYGQWPWQPWYQAQL
jgi:hypothetical protein